MTKRSILVICCIALICATSLFAGGKKETAAPSGGGNAAPSKTAITLWVYPIGGWGNQATVSKLLADFHAANPNIQVTVDYLTYADGDDKVNTAIEGGAAPDLVMEGPERLVANWGAKGKMVDISDLFDASDKTEINAAALSACFTADGKKSLRISSRYDSSLYGD